MPASSSNTMVHDIPNPAFFAEDRSITEIKHELLLRIRSGEEFPVTSAAISLIGQLTSEQEVPIGELANVVLGDYGLTSKLLKLINSVYYLRFGEVTTVSRAIVLLGTDHLRDIALSVTLFERLQIDASQDMVNLLCRAVYAAVIGRRMATRLGYGNPEEAFICALFHSLGEMLTAYYAPETYASLTSISTASEESTRTRASLLYISLGKEIAQGWRFPARIVLSMERPTVQMREQDNIYHLCCISSGANHVARIVEEDLDPEARKRKLERVLKSLHLSPSLVDASILDAGAPMDEIHKYCSLYGISFDRSAIAQCLSKGVEKAKNADDLSKPFITTDITGYDATSPSPQTDRSALVASFGPDPQDDPETVFTKGLREVGDAFLEECPLDDILTIILETIYRGLKPFGLSRTLLMVRDTQRPLMEVRLALGDSLAHLKSWFSVPVQTGGSDIFNVALAGPKSIFVNDSIAEAANGQAKIPQWLIDHGDGSMAIAALPLHIKRVSIGLIYLEGEKDFFNTVPQSYLNYLSILHQQAILAIRQR